MRRMKNKVAIIDGGGIRTPLLLHGLAQARHQLQVNEVSAAVEKFYELARLALLIHPLIGQWEAGDDVLTALTESDPHHLGYLRPNAGGCAQGVTGTT